LDNFIVVTFSNVVGLEGDGGLNGGGLAAGLGANVQVGVVEKSLGASSRHIVDPGCQTCKGRIPS